MMKRLIVGACLVAALAATWWFVTSRPAAPVPEAASGDEAPEPRWLDALYSRNPREVEAASREVTRLGPAAIPVIQRVLRNPQSSAERLKAALKACTILGKDAAPAVEDVASVLEEEGLTAEAALALSYMGPAAVPPLRGALDSADPMVRRESLRSIGKLKERAPLDAATVSPLLVRGMKDPDPAVRAVAATYLGIVRGMPEQSVALLTAALQDESPEVRREAAAALGGFGDAAVASIPALRKAAQDRNPDVAREAGRAIVELQK